MTLFIGNNMVDDMDNAVERRVPTSIVDNTHFEFLNRTAARKRRVGPLPKVNAVANLAITEGGGGSSGPCGPNNANGKSTTGGG